MEEPSKAAVFHEIKMILCGAVAVNAIWWVSVMVIGLAFPFMHLVLAFFLVCALGYFDNREFPGEVSTTVYAWRALTSLLIFFLGLVLIGPLGIVLTTTVPTGLVSFVMATFAISSIIAIARCSIIAMILIHRLTETRKE